MAEASLWRTVATAALAAVAALSSIIAVSPAQATDRVALVVGNAVYAHAPALANPLHDAVDVGVALARLGFTVTRLENADYAALRRGLLEFMRAASATEVALVFYAGHGIEVDQHNFLVPVDARLASDQDVEFEAVPLELVLRAVARASGLRLVILDACRENPFAASMRHAGATRSVGRGLAGVEPAGVEPARETLVAYAAKEGTVAADGEGRNSPYSEALLRYLEEPGLEVGLMFRKVRDAVLASTGGRQEPSVYGSLSSRGAYLTARPVLPDSLSSTDLLADSQSATDRLAAERLATERLSKEEELLYWESVKDSEEAAELRAYLDRYPSGAYEALARIRLKRLEGASDGSEPPESTGSAAPAQEAFSVPVPGPESVESSLEPSRAERRWIQERLAALGFDPGPTDGLFGHGTREAIGRWQSSQGEPATGYLDAEAAKALLAAAEERKRPERERASREPGRSFRDCPVCPVMVVVPAGSFMMGSPPSEADRHADEGPVHRVTISEPLAVGVYEVTFSEWEACVRGGGCGGYRPADSGWGRGNRPVINVSWKDASAYAEWLSRKTGKRYRLLSESEWEYVARAGTTTRYWWGNTVDRDRANCMGCGGHWEARKRTAPVGSFSPNAFGLHDVHGNSWEWVEDCWSGSYRGAPADGTAWTSGSCSLRVLRGGSWKVIPEVLRSANRGRGSTGDRSIFNGFGFRMARTLTP